MSEYNYEIERKNLLENYSDDEVEFFSKILQEMNTNLEEVIEYHCSIKEDGTNVN